MRGERLAELLGGGDRLQSAAHNKTCADFVGVVAKAVFEQLGVGEYHAELVVEPVEEFGHLRQARIDGWPARRRGFRRHG